MRIPFISPQVLQVWPLIRAVTLNICLTLSIWIFVYGTETDNNSRALYLFDSRSNFTTGHDIFDGLLNGFICLISLATLSFVMLAFALYDFRRLLQFWLVVSCLLINFLISASLFRDIFQSFSPYDRDAEMPIAFFALPAIYGAVGCAVFFTDRLPSVFHQFYVICNCSMVSLFYLRTFPNQTTWFVLAGIIIWDLFAVLTPLGPLRRITEKAGDYSETMLRLLMFHVNTDNEAVALASRDDHCQSDDHSGEFDHSEPNVTTACSSVNRIPTDEDEPLVKESTRSDTTKALNTRTAHDALQDANVTRLGMGDFVFYSLLVGKAAASGSVPATLAAAIGVLFGLIVTLTAFPDYEDSVPALPVSVFLGIFLHFVTLLVFEPLGVFLLEIVKENWDIWSNYAFVVY